MRGPCSVLDYGCGSGILSIAARKLGAPRVVGADIDPQALSASAENARLNAVEASFVAPDALGDERFDIVVANILTSVLLALASQESQLFVERREPLLHFASLTGEAMPFLGRDLRRVFV